RQAKLEGYSGKRLDDFLRLIASGIDAEVPVDPAGMARPGWVGRVLFRQCLLLFARKDHGPERGSALKGRIALLGAAWGFAKGRGAVPRVHNRFPDATFEQVEAQRRLYSPEIEQTLDRYYLIKVESLQFCGPT